MASTTLYPPLVDSYTAAFIPSTLEDGTCRVYYSLSKFSSSVENIRAIHFLITKQSSGESVIYRQDDPDNGRYRMAGVLMVQGNNFMNAVDGEDNLYYTDIVGSDVGMWNEGWIYKIQIRFSNLAYDSSMGQAAWLNQHASEFSEWSSYTITKAISKPVITIPLFDYNSSLVNNNSNSIASYNIFSSTLDVSGAYSNADASEILYSYKVKLKDNNGKLLEESDLIYANQYIPNQFNYIFKTELENEKEYDFELDYETLNKYTNTIKIHFAVALLISEITDNIQLLTAEDALAQPYTSIEEEQSDGRIGLKLYYKDEIPYFGNVCIRRSDSRTNFTVWDDIAFVQITVPDGEKSVNDLPLIYDYTAESGVWYQYGIQFIDLDGYRSTMVKHAPIKREYDYAFILGENNQQLRLEYNHTINSFKTNLSDSKLDTIGGQYPFITRNGNMKYKTFPINGLISFNMDEHNLFTTMKDIYQYDEVVDLYNQEEITMYDYTYERDFRNKVIEFLQDGKYKLFKSPTEGNIIVRLMDVNTTPDAKLGRLISNFSANAHEVATANMANYKKYGFCTPGEFKNSLTVTDTRFGQLMESVSKGQNIITLIVNKYKRENIIGTNEVVIAIDNLDITIEGPEADVELYRTTPGYILNTNQSGDIKIFNNYFNFDGMVFSPTDTLSVKEAGADTVDVILNFTYTVSITPTENKRIKQKMVTVLPGEISKTMYPGECVFDQVYIKYFYDWEQQYSIVREINEVEIEADAGTVFDIMDANDITKFDRFVMNDTNTFKISSDKIPYIKDIIYVGKSITTEEGESVVDLNESGKADVSIKYIVKVEEGVCA